MQLWLSSKGFFGCVYALNGPPKNGQVAIGLDPFVFLPLEQ